MYDGPPHHYNVEWSSFIMFFLNINLEQAWFASNG